MKTAGTILILGLTTAALGDVRIEQNPQGQLVYRLDHKALLTEKAKKELQSGLATQILILAKLNNAQGQPEAEQLKKVSIRYDLWDERYWMEIAPDQSKTSFAKLADAEAWVEAPGPFTWMKVSDLKPDAQYRLEVMETINPVNADRLEEIQKWMIQQRLTKRVGGTDGSLGEVSIGNETPFTALFYRLWKKAAEGDLAGEVQVTSVSAPFTRTSVLKKEAR